MKIIVLSELARSGRLMCATVFILITFCYLLYAFTGREGKSSWIYFVKYRLDFCYRYFLVFISCVYGLISYYYRRYYEFTYFYFFFTKLFRTPIEIFIKIIRFVLKSDVIRFLLAKIWEIIVSTIIIILFNFVTKFFYQIPHYIFEFFCLVSSWVLLEDFALILADFFSMYSREFIHLTNAVTRRDLSPIFIVIFIIMNMALCVLWCLLSLLFFVFYIFFVCCAFSFFFWVFYLPFYIFFYTRFLISSRSLQFFCETQYFVFSKASLLFVPFSTIVFKKRRYWASDEEIELQKEIELGKRPKPYFDPSNIFTPGDKEFPNKVLEQEYLLANPPTINRLLLHDELLDAVQNSSVSLDNNLVQRWLHLSAFKQKQIPFLFMSPDNQQGVPEKGFTKLFWINDLVVNKAFINRLNYSVVENYDASLISDSMITKPVCQTIIYCENNLSSVTAVSNSVVSVTPNLKISVCKSLSGQWVDLDYNQYIRQFVLNRVFNKLKFTSLNGTGQSDQHLTINAGVRSAVYKVYTPDFLKQNEKNFLNNPFKNEYIFDLHAASLATKKGRTVALGKTTDVIAVLKSLQNLYQTLDCFSKPLLYELEKTYRLDSFFNFSKERIKTSYLEQNLISKKFTEFCLVSPFTFLPYSHIHHVSYETRPDRFYLLPTSIDNISRSFLNRLLFKFVKQLNLNWFLTASREAKSNFKLSASNNSFTTVLAKIEYVLYKFFASCSSEEKTISQNKKNLSTETLVSLSPKKNISQFNFLYSISKGHKLIDVLFTCDALFSSINFPIFGSKALSLLYTPCYSSLLKLLGYFTKQGNIVTLQTSSLSLLYNFFNLEKTQINNISANSLQYYVFLIWRALIKSIQKNFEYFLPKIFLQQSYNYLLMVESTTKKVGGLGLEHRYAKGFLKLSTTNFLYPFTAVYNRSLLSFGVNSLLDSTKVKFSVNSNSVNTTKGLNGSLTVVADKKLTRFIWWWLDRAPSFRTEMRRIALYNDEPFSFSCDRFLTPFLVESISGVNSLDFLNFASLAYDPTGSLGATNINPSERFLLSENVSAVYSKYNDLYPVADFVRQDVLRKDLQNIAGSDAYHLEEERLYSIFLENEVERKKREEPQIAGQEEKSKIAAREAKARKERFSDSNGVFGWPKWDAIRVDDVMKGSMMPRMTGLEPNGSGYPARFWGWSYYNEFLIEFFQVFNYIKFNRARLKYKSFGLHPLAVLLLFFKKNKSLFKPKQKFRVKRKDLFKAKQKIILKKHRRESFKRILVFSFLKYFATRKQNAIVSQNTLNDIFGGSELHQRGLFRSLQKLAINFSRNSCLTKQLIPVEKGLRKSYVNFDNKLEKEKPISFKVYNLMYPCLVKVFQAKSLFKISPTSNSEILLKKNINLQVEQASAASFVHIKKAAKTLNKVRAKEKIVTGSLKINYGATARQKSSVILQLLRAAYYTDKYRKRVMRRAHNIRSFFTTGHVALKPRGGVVRTTPRKHPTAKMPYKARKGYVRARRKLFRFSDITDEEGDARVGKKLLTLMNLKKGSLGRTKKNQNYFMNSFDFAKFNNSLYGQTFLEKTKNTLESFFFSKNNRKISYLKKFLTNSDILSVLSLFHSSLFNKNKTLSSYYKVLFLLKLLKQKQNLSNFNNYKNLLLFRSLKVSKNFLYSEHSFEECFFSLLSQRTPVVQNSILVKPISRSLLLHHNHFSKKVTLSTNKNLNFSSTTVANLLFFNYIFLGKGSFFGNTITNPQNSFNNIEVIEKVYDYVKKSFIFDIYFRAFAQIFSQPKKSAFSLPVLFTQSRSENSTIHTSRSLLRLLTSHKKLPFFIQWPFKLSKQLNSKKTKKKRKLVETTELRTLRGLFFQNKLNFLNLVLSKLIPWYVTQKASGFEKTQNELLGINNLKQKNNLQIKHSAVKQQVADAALGLLLNKNSKTQTGRSKFIYFVKKTHALYHKHPNLERFFNWAFNPLPAEAYKHWKKVFEISNYNLLFQKTQYLKQYKKNILDYGIHHKFSLLSFDLRSQLPVQPFTRIYQFSKKNQPKVYKKKRLKVGSAREYKRYPWVMKAFVRFYKGKKKHFINNKASLKTVSSYYKNFSSKKNYKQLPVFKNITNLKRRKFYGRKNLLRHRLGTLNYNRKFKVSKNISLQSAFKRSLAAAVRFNDLASDLRYSILPLYSTQKTPWLSTSLMRLRANPPVRIKIKKLKLLFNIKGNDTGSSRLRDSKNLIKFLDDYYIEDLRIVNKSAKVTEFSNQISSFERPGFRLSFVSELITRKFLINQQAVPVWFLNWMKSEGYVLLYRYVAYKQHSFTTLPQVYHAPIPNSSGIEKIAAAFNLTLDSNLLLKTSKKFYRPLFSVLKRKQLQFKKAVSFSFKRSGTTLAVGDPTTYDLLLSKAVKSLVMTQGVLKEIQKTRWHKTEYCQANRFGWLLPVWSTRTFTRFNVLNFISLKKHTSLQNYLTLNSFTKQLTVNHADGYFYYLLLKEKSTSGVKQTKSTKLFNKNPEPLFSALNSPFSALNQRAFFSKYKGFSSIFTRSDLAQFKNLIRWGFRFTKFKQFRKNKRILRLMQARKFRQSKTARFPQRKNFRIRKKKKNFFDFLNLRKRKPVKRRNTSLYRENHYKIFYSKNKYFYKEEFPTRVRERWGNFRYCFTRSKRVLQTSLIMFLFYIRTICYQRVLRKLVNAWGSRKKKLLISKKSKYDRKIRKTRPASFYYSYKVAEKKANKHVPRLFGTRVRSTLRYNADYPPVLVFTRSKKGRRTVPLAKTFRERLKRRIKLTRKQKRLKRKQILKKEFLKRWLLDFDNVRGDIPYLSIQRKFMKIKKPKVTNKAKQTVKKPKINKIKKPKVAVNKAKQTSKKTKKSKKPQTPKKPKVRKSKLKFRRLFSQTYYPTGQLPRTARFCFFYQHRTFLIKQQNKKASYFTFLNRSSSRIRASRALRKNYNVYKKTILLRPQLRLRNVLFGLDATLNKTKNLNFNLLENTPILQKKKNTEAVIFKSINQKISRSGDSSFFFSKKQGRENTLLLRALNNKVFFNKLPVLKNAITRDVNTPFSVEEREPWEPQQPLRFLKYTNKFYFERTSRYARSITSLPTLFSTKHLTVSFERFNHEHFRSLNKGIRFSTIYEQLQETKKENNIHDNEYDYELDREATHNYSLTRDEQAYTEKSFSYALTHLYGLHQPAFDIFLTKDTSKLFNNNDLCATRSTPWWMQRYVFRKNSMHFTNVDNISSFRNSARWGTYLKKIPKDKGLISTNVFETYPNVWFNRWVNDKLGNPYWGDWKSRTSYHNYRMTKYRKFFRLHQQTTMKQMGGVKQHKHSRSFWRNVNLCREVNLPFTFTYFREDLSSYSGLLHESKVIDSCKRQESNLKSLILDACSYFQPFVGSTKRNFSNLEKSVTGNVVGKSVHYSLNNIVTNSFVPLTEQDYEESQLLNDFLLVKQLKEQKKLLTVLEVANVCNICYFDLIALEARDTTAPQGMLQLTVNRSLRKLLDNQFAHKKSFTFYSYFRYLDEIPGRLPFSLFGEGLRHNYNDVVFKWIYAPLAYERVPNFYNFSDFARRSSTTRYITRTNRKAFSLFFNIDESRSNNFTNKRAFTAFQVTKLATVFNYGSSLGLFNQRVSTANTTGLTWFSEATLPENLNLKSFQNNSRAVRANYSENSPDFFTTTTKNQKQILSFTWFFLSRSWGAVQSYGFTNSISYAFFWMIPTDRLYTVPFYVINLCTTMLLASLEDFFTRYLTGIFFFLTLFSFILVFSFIFLL